MLQAGGERTALGEEMPFSPSTYGHYVEQSRAELLLLQVQQWRLPMTVTFVALIGLAAFFAYSTKGGDEQATSTSSVDGGEGAGDPSGGLGALDGDGSGQSDEGSSDDALANGRTTTTTSRATTTDRPSTTNASGSVVTTIRPQRPTTASTGSSTSTTSALTTTTRQGTVSTSASTVSTVPTSTTAPPPTTTTIAPTTSTTGPPRPVYLGDRVTIGDFDGPGLAGVAVSLYLDVDEDGSGDQLVATTTSDGAGAYSFEADPGCYEVVFTVPAGRSHVGGRTNHSVCLDSGGTNATLDLVLSSPLEPQPPSCEVQIGSGSFAGVEIQDPARNWAPSYAFYDAAGNRLLSTASLGPPDDTTNPDNTTIEWTSQYSGYEESTVYSVAAENADGLASAPITCSRRNIS